MSLRSLRILLSLACLMASAVASAAEPVAQVRVAFDRNGVVSTRAEGMADLATGRKVTADMVRKLIPEELAKVKATVGPDSPTYDRAAQIFEKMSTQDAFSEFLTLPLYEELA